MLEAKSALYNKLSNGEIEGNECKHLDIESNLCWATLIKCKNCLTAVVPSDEDTEDGRFLVDFHQKTLSKVTLRLMSNYCVSYWNYLTYSGTFRLSPIAFKEYGKRRQGGVWWFTRKSPS